MKVREAMMSGPVQKYLKQAGYARVHAEVPVFHCVMDLYGTDPTAGRTAAVEIKVADWRRAVRQARIYQLCADLVYVAIHASYAHRVRGEELREIGLGLLVVSLGGRSRPARTVVEALPARVSAIKREQYVQRVLEQVGGCE